MYDPDLAALLRTNFFPFLDPDLPSGPTGMKESLLRLAEVYEQQVQSLDRQTPFRRGVLHGDLAVQNLVATVREDGQPVIVSTNFLSLFFPLLVLLLIVIIIIVKHYNITIFLMSLS